MHGGAFIRLRDGIVRQILNTRIYDRIEPTPLQPAPVLSAMCGVPVLFKREDMQPVFSFKLRGAYHKMTQLPAAQLAGGVIAASAGNHAQGVAWSAKRLGCPAVIVMPKFTPRIRVQAVKAHGAHVILHGEVFDDAYQYAQKLAQEKRRLFIPPFDDADIIAGNGTIAAELLRQCPRDLGAIFCAVGGGGLISGIAAYVKTLRPDIKIIGVESEESASMTASVRAKRRVTLPRVGIFADSVAVKQPGKLPFEIARRLVDEWCTVDNDELCAAIKDVYDNTRVVVEPAGALSVAAIKKYRQQKTLRAPVAAVICGANMNFDRLRFIAERAEIGEKREMLLAVTIPERPGSFAGFCSFLRGYNVTEFNYRLADPVEAHIFVGLEIERQSDRAVILQKLKRRKLPTLDLTDDEMSKLHIRHMVGGRAQATDERLYRFEFPERPGALRDFLTELNRSGNRWNISLFHYRNHGADIGRVLCGIQVPQSDRQRCEESFDRLGYPYWREEHNRAYSLFLAP